MQISATVWVLGISETHTADFLSLTLASKLVGCREVGNNLKNPSVSVSTLRACLALLKRDRYHFPVGVRAASLSPKSPSSTHSLTLLVLLGSSLAQASDISSEFFQVYPDPNQASCYHVNCFLHVWMFAAPSNPSSSSYKVSQASACRQMTS